ncbi:MAG: VanZ family protein [Leptospirillia bacterium]
MPPYPHADKLIHCAAFALLAGLTVWGMSRAWPKWQTRRVLLLALFLAATYGALDELHQHYVPYRHTDPLDFIADVTGALMVIGWLAWRRTRRLRSAATLDGEPG